MDSFEFNKMAMAVLGTVFVVLGLNFLAEGIFESHAPETPSYAIAAVDSEADAGSGETAAATIEPVGPLLASADLGAGESVFKKCASCHTFEEGGSKKVGPNLWNIVERPIASSDGFAYSAAMKEFSAGGKTWTYDELNAFLAAPKAHVKGTSMGFAGLKKVDERANVIAWLRTHSATPVALPAQ